MFRRVRDSWRCEFVDGLLYQGCLKTKESPVLYSLASPFSSIVLGATLKLAKLSENGDLNASTYGCRKPHMMRPLYSPVGGWGHVPFFFGLRCDDHDQIECNVFSSWTGGLCVRRSKIVPKIPDRVCRRSVGIWMCDCSLKTIWLKRRLERYSRPFTSHTIMKSGLSFDTVQLRTVAMILVSWFHKAPFIFFAT